MKAEISRVTSPVVYISMLFSWFAWRVEDHDFHSFRYMYTGAGRRGMVCRDMWRWSAFDCSYYKQVKPGNQRCRRYSDLACPQENIAFWRLADNIRRKRLLSSKKAANPTTITTANPTESLCPPVTMANTNTSDLAKAIAAATSNLKRGAAQQRIMHAAQSTKQKQPAVVTRLNWCHLTFSTHLIQGDGTFNTGGFDSFIKQVIMAECAFSDGVVVIMGPQNSGHKNYESKLLPTLLIINNGTKGETCDGSFFPSQMKMSRAVVQGQWFTVCDSGVAIQWVSWVYPISTTGNETLTARSSLIS
uniref:Lysine-specific demethylase REF6 n=1 Tax=Tanacetum cinerariifolium TaxID=118510 RepID=A0A6L2NMU1_TANCI|nr:lysine-specific demethylase REF6 [Tanacetum cinerariifolium]